MDKSFVKRADAISDWLIDALRAAMLILPVMLYPVGSLRAAESFSVTETIEAEISTTETPDDGFWGTERDEGSASAQGLARFGPFEVVRADKAVLTDGIDTAGPRHFAAMMARFPGIRTLEIIDCPGSEDDDANMTLGRMIRRAGIATHVPAGGSVRSGGVDLFLAGAIRTADPGAEFGVHSWADDEGNDARSIPATDPVHQRYLGYYHDMGMSGDAARAFYDFTNRAAPPEGLYVMSGAERARFGLIAGR
jgi:hypothetical protein